MPVRVGIIGAGPVGTTLGSRLLKNGGYEVSYGSRDPTSSNAKKVLTSQPEAKLDSVAAVVESSDIVILTTPGMHEKEDLVKQVTPLAPAVNGKPFIDATNPLSAYPALEVMWNGTSAGEIIQEALPGAFVYKAFNTISVEHMGAPDGSLITGEQLTMLFAGALDKKDAVSQLITDVGFVPVYVGPIRYSRNLEAIAELYIHLKVPTAGFTTENFNNFHFQYIHK